MSLYDFEESIGLHDNTGKAALDLVDSYGGNADEEAEKRKYQRITGTPAVLMGDPEVFQDAKKQAYMQSLALKNSPATTAFAGAPGNAPLVYDDIDAMREFEGKAKDASPWIADVVKPTPTRAFISYRKGAGGLNQFIGENIVQPIGGLFSKEKTNWFTEVGKAMKFEADQVEKQLNLEHPLESHSWAANTASALQSMYLQAPLMVAGFLASTAKAGMGLVLGGMGALTGGVTYGERREKGFSPMASTLSAAWDATVEVGTELLPTSTLFSMLKPAAKMSFSRLVGQGAKMYGEEMVGESLATFLQDANDRFMDKPDTPVGERISNISEYVSSGDAYQNWMDTLKSTFIQTSLMGGAGMGVNRFRQSRMQEAQSRQAAFIDTLTAAEATRLHTRSPEDFADFAQRVGDQHGLSTVYLQSDRAIEEGTKLGYTEEQIPAWLAQYGVAPEDLTTAIQTGGIIQMDFGKVATGFKTDEALKALQNDIMINPSVAALAQTEGAVKVEAEHLAHLSEMFQRDQANKINTDDMDLWKETLLNTPGLRGRVKEESLMLLAARANTLSALTGTPAIEHLNRMLRSTGLQAIKFKDFQGRPKPNPFMARKGERSLLTWLVANGKVRLGEFSDKTGDAWSREHGVRSKDRSREMGDVAAVSSANGKMAMDEAATTLNSEGWGPQAPNGESWTANDLFNVISETGKGRNIFIPDKADDMMERQIRRETDARAEEQAAEQLAMEALAAEGIDASRIEASSGSVVADLEEEANKEGTLHSEDAAAAELDDFFTAVSNKTPTEPPDQALYQMASVSPEQIAEAKRQYDEVVARYKGTPLWMKAPNGKPTNLTEQQWAQVRTKAFKEWFGDWEAVANATPNRQASTFHDARGEAELFVGKEITNLETGTIATVSRTNLEKMTSGSAAKKSTNAEDHALAIANADQLFRSARLDDRHPDRNGEPTIAEILRFVAPMVTKKGDVVAVKMTVKKTTSPKQPNPLYTIETIKIEKPALEAPQSGIEWAPDDSRNTPQASFSHNVLALLHSVNADSVSRVVDENGEPLVVYHGAVNKFNIFNGRNRGMAQFPAEIGASFFTSDKEMARGYAGGTIDPMALFLNIKNPNTHDAKGGWWISHNFKAIKQAKDDGNDGVVMQNVIDTSAGQAERPIDTYITFSPTQIKFATGNVGTFSGDTGNISYQTATGMAPMAALSVTASGENIISLFETANKSSFLHETAHIFLKDLQYVSENLGVQTAEWTKVKEWLNVGEDNVISQQQHERFAETFEVYLETGQAPTLELRGAFRKFKKWLTAIYGMITSKQYGQKVGYSENTDMAGKEIVVSPEIADMFHRLLATEQEITAAREQAALIAMLDEKLLNETGFTPAQIAEYRAIVAQAEDSAREKRDKHKLVGHADRMKEWKQQAAEEAAKIPVYAFSEQMQEIGISRKSIVDQYGSEGIPTSSPMFKGAGLDINVAIAEHGKLFGYENAGSFVGDLRASKGKAQWMQNRVVQLEAEYDNRQDTSDAIRTASLRRQLELESEWLAKQAAKADAAYQKRQAAYEQRWKDADAAFSEAVKLGKKDEEIRVLKERAAKAKQDRSDAFKDQTTIPRATMRIWADKTVGGRTMSQIMNVDKMLAESRRHRQQAIAFARQGKWADALIANEHSRLTEELISSSYRAMNKFKKMETKWRSIAKWTNDNNSVKVGTKYRDQINRLLDQYGIARKVFDPAAPDLHSFVSSMSEDELDSSGTGLASWIGVMTGDYAKLNWDQLQDLNDALAYLYGNGRDEVNGAKLSNGDDVKAYAYQIAKKQDGLKDMPDIKSDATRIGKILQGVQKNYRKYFARTSILRFAAQRMDGYMNVGTKGTMGPAEQLVQNIVNGMARSNDMWTEISGKIEPQLKILTKESGKVFGDIRLPDKFQRYGLSWTKERVVAACLNMGNAGNMQRLRDGYELTDTDIHQIAGKLTAEEWQAVQTIWDTVNTLWPMINDVHEKLNYFRRKKIEAQPLSISTADGHEVHLDGGYYPVAYDKNIDRKAAEWSEKDDILASHEATLQIPVAKSGFAKNRAEVVRRPLNLSLSVLGTHFNDTIRYIALAETIRDADRVFRNKDLESRNIDTIGREMVDMIRPALKQTLRPNPKDYGVFERGRVLMSIYYMGYNAWTALQNITGIFPAIRQAGADNYFNGIYHTLKMGNPYTAYKAMLEASPYMRLREANIERDLKTQLRTFSTGGMEINGKRYTYDDVKSLGFAGIRFVDSVISLPAWWGKYNAEMDLHGDVQKATDAADSAVNKALGSGLAIDSTEWGRHPFFTLFAPFMSFASTQQEVLATERAAWKEGKISNGEFLYGHLMTWVLPAVLSTFMQGALMYGLLGAVGGGDDKKKKDWEDYLTDLISYRLMGMPFVRDAYNSLLQGFEKKAPITSARMPITEAYKMVQQLSYRFGNMDGSEKTTKAAMWASAEIASLYSGIPATRIYERWMRGQKNIENGSGWWGNHFVPQEKKK